MIGSPNRRAILLGAVAAAIAPRLARAHSGVVHEVKIERFRFVPFLVTDDPPAGQPYGKDWCTSCGICAKVCPPQCIWIKRGKLPNGRPNPEPEQFYIDIDICMNLFNRISQNFNLQLSMQQSLTNRGSGTPFLDPLLQNLEAVRDICFLPNMNSCKVLIIFILFSFFDFTPFSHLVHDHRRDRSLSFFVLSFLSTVFVLS